MENELTDLQFAILDALYFVEPFEHILEEVNEPEALVAAELRNLIALRWVQPMRFDEQQNDYLRSQYYDPDNLYAYRYLATKEGLLKHTGRR